MERVKGIEPSFLAWEANVLPLNYTRDYLLHSMASQPVVKIFMRICGKGRSLSENREPTVEKPFWPIFSIIFVK